MEINVIHPHQVDFFWPTVERHIQASQDRGPTDMTMAQIKNLCRTDERWRLVIFNHFEAAMVVRVWDEWLHIVALGGRFEPGWRCELFDWLNKIAKFIGARFITLGGRKGWERVLKPMGFKPIGGPFLGYEVIREVEP